MSEKQSMIDRYNEDLTRLLAATNAKEQAKQKAKRDVQSVMDKCRECFDKFMDDADETRGFNFAGNKVIGAVNDNNEKHSIEHDGEFEGICFKLHLYPIVASFDEFLPKELDKREVVINAIKQGFVRSFEMGGKITLNDMSFNSRFVNAIEILDADGNTLGSVRNGVE